MSKRPISSFFTSVKKHRSTTTTSPIPTTATAAETATAAAPAAASQPNSNEGGPDSPSSTNKATKTYTVFCDLDGVLVDFDAGVRKLMGGKSPDQIPPHRLWPTIHKTAHFFRDLPWTSDGEELWDALRETKCHLNILTGVSMRGPVVQDKYEWCRRELCVETHLVDMTGTSGRKHEPANPHVKRKKKNECVVNVIACWSKNKHYESKPGHILIDDREKLRKDWEMNGGTFILHTSTRSTLEALTKVGIRPPKGQWRTKPEDCETKASPSQVDCESSRAKEGGAAS